MTIEANSVTFRMLSRLFRYPERAGDLREALACLSENGAPEMPEVTEADLGPLQNEYIRLFVNSLPEIPCPPYGSYYLEGTLKGRSTVGLEKLYADYGFETGELADHIGVELEFLSILSLLGDIREVRQDAAFVMDHLRGWLPEFFDRVAASDESGFYAAWAETVKHVLVLLLKGSKV